MEDDIPMRVPRELRMLMQSPGGGYRPVNSARNRAVYLVVVGGILVAGIILVTVTANACWQLSLTSSHEVGSGGQVVLEGASAEEESDPFPLGFVKEEHCGVDFRIQNVVHSNLGGQGPDHGEEGIVFNCTQKDNGKYIRNVLVKVNAKSEYESKSSSKNGKQNDFGSIRVDSGKKVDVRYSIWDMDEKPLTVDTFRVTFYDLDEGPHGSSREFIIADDMTPDSTRDGSSTEVKEKTVHNDQEFLASHTGNGADNPRDSQSLTQLQKDRSVVLEYKDVHYFDTTLGSSHGKSARNFAFALHSALACHEVKVAITTLAPTTTVAPAEPFNWIPVLIAIALVVACCLVLLCLAMRKKEEASPKEPEPLEENVVFDPEPEPKLAEPVPAVVPEMVKEEVIEKPAPAPEPEPVVVPVEEPPFLSVYFLDSEQSEHVATWYDKPLGFTFTQDTTPVLVTKVVQGSKAENLGVKVGMEVTHVEFTGHGKTSVEQDSFHVINDLLSQSVSKLPQETDRPYLALAFEMPPSTEPLLKTWYTHPLGCSFSATTPMVITKVEPFSRAWELGVEEGQVLRSIAGTAMPEPLDVKSLDHIIVKQHLTRGREALRPEDKGIAA
jgi:hypothetical protein